MTLPPDAVWAAFGGSVEGRGRGVLTPVPPATAAALQHQLSEQ